MRFGVVVVALIASACVRTETTACGDEVCPAGTSCATVTTESGAMQTRCANPAQLAACEDHADGDACELAGIADATCNGGACFADLCGDGLRGVVEACDDANILSGDGCASDCRSAEVCGNGIVDPITLVEGQRVLDEQCDDGNARAHDGCAVCEAEVARWTRIPVAKPTDRAHHGMAFDTRRHELVMFGGDDATGQNPSETWMWNGLGWRARIADIEPPGRSGGGFVYDSARDRLVVFGGADSSLSIATREVWEWTGVGWEERVVTNGPGARYEHGMVYDSIRKRTYVVGGFEPSATGGSLGDTWAWDGSTWTQIIPPTPADAFPRRSRMAIAFDPVRGETVAFGGAIENTGLPSGETWLFDGLRWRRVTPTTAPSARRYASMAWDPTSQRIILFGGDDGGGPLSDAWAWNGSTWTALPGGPQARFAAAMATDYARGGVVMYGGTIVFNATKRDTWWWNGTAWIDQTSTFEPRLSAAGAAYDPTRDTIVVFGGIRTSPTAVINTTLARIRGIWFDVTPTSAPNPAPRQHAHLLYAPTLRMVILWGGFAINGNPVDDGTWGWDGSQWRSLAPAGTPPSRFDASIAFDAARGEVVLFGGRSMGIALDDTWVFDGATWTRRTPTTSPSPRYLAAAGYDAIRQVIVTTGGRNNTGFPADMWTWDGSTWTEQVQSTRPPVHLGATLSWNTSRQRLLMAGGEDLFGTASKDVWELDNTTWYRVDTPTAPARGSLVVIGTSSGLLRLSGTNNLVEEADTWRLRWESTAPDEVCESAIDIDGDRLVGCADPDCDERCVECGDGTCSSIEDCRVCPGDCGACAERCGDTVCGQAESATSCPSDC